MAHNELSEKLDQLTIDELGFDFNEDAVWSKLEGRLHNRRGYVIWWSAAASVLIGFTLFFSRLFTTDITVEPTVVEQIITPGIGLPVLEEEKEIMQDDLNESPQQVLTKTLRKRGITPIAITELPDQAIVIKPMELPQQEIQLAEKSLFAAEDISIIQASLEKPQVEKGRKMSIRAQWHQSPSELNVNYKALKIKLYEQEKKQ